MGGYKFITILFASVAVGALLSGCTDATRDQYAQAGKTADHAISTDVQKIETNAKREGRQLDNASMTPKIKMALGSAADLKSGSIAVTTVGHSITLTGDVPSSAQKQRASEIATSIAGDKYHVVDDLHVGATKL